MNAKFTEEEMRRALFGEVEPTAPVANSLRKGVVPENAAGTSVKATTKKFFKGFTPSRLKVTLRVGNEFEGEMHELVYEADTLSSLVAEQGATKAARKKFRFVEVVSVVSM
ncbi:hypothetical protein [Pseudomonas khavaziana]|uniref:hypothetical protein n=1 Tax=Pseudomonas khavaziana TaxID=2842351 RepID=UPI001C3D2DDB|nr:hypothetical protein [Pseudomonas khavaziana]MBV4483881.1 hypothetical protein [Pseudomonas khavaziana]